MTIPAARQWYRFSNQASNPAVAEIYILDAIGSWDDDWFARNFGLDMGITARQFVEDLAALPSTVNTIHVHINSPGGDIQAGINITNALRQQQIAKGRTVETFVDGIAASIASVIAMAGSVVHMADNALMMLHDPYCGMIGNAGELRQQADVLDTMRDQIVATYRWHSDKPAEDLIAMMAAESWLNAEEAIAAGLATDVVTGLRAAASISRAASGALKVPEKYSARVLAFLAPAPATRTPAGAQDVLRICRVGEVLDLAESLIGEGLTLEEAQARVDTAKASRTASAERETVIRAAFASANLADLADGYVASGMPLATVKAHLVTLTARLHAGEIESNLPPSHGRAKVAIDVMGFYALPTRSQERAS